MNTWPNRGASGGPCGGLGERKTKPRNGSDQAGLTQANRPPRNPVRFSARRVEARVHGAEPAAHGGAQRKLNGAKALVGLTGASLAEGGWRVRSNKLELPHGGGSGERCVKP